ncbi:hypothetical protein FKM52_12030 [Mixta tenebrionis]|uniref:Uncharacterized protein n=2 Tax=Mixta tenebrionis TaxID=2562439 RepID=A0A506V965_9GAMM|nr:hypothetical protein FKM52_12030 [Mixta tenebrionis]
MRTNKMTTTYTPYIDVSVNAQWDDWQNYPQGRPNPVYTQRVIDWKMDGLILAFLTFEPKSRSACWAAQPTMPLEWAKPLADDLNAFGKKVIVSFGGAANYDISAKLTVEELVATYEKTIALLGVTGLDFDLENDLYDADKICQALKRVQKNYPDVALSFTLPVMPAGLTNTGLGIVRKAADAGLDFVVNGMAMDYYNPAYYDHMGKAANDAVTSMANQMAAFYPTLSLRDLYNKVAVTPMIGKNDDMSMFTLENAREVGVYAREHNVAFIGSWSLNRDNPSNSQWVELESSSNPQQTYSCEYAKYFIG